MITVQYRCVQYGHTVQYSAVRTRSHWLGQTKVQGWRVHRVSDPFNTLHCSRWEKIRACSHATLRKLLSRGSVKIRRSLREEPNVLLGLRKDAQ